MKDNYSLPAWFYKQGNSEQLKEEDHYSLPIWFVNDGSYMENIQDWFFDTEEKDSRDPKDDDAPIHSLKNPFFGDVQVKYVDLKVRLLVTHYSPHSLPLSPF